MHNSKVTYIRRSIYTEHKKAMANALWHEQRALELARLEVASSRLPRAPADQHEEAHNHARDYLAVHHTQR